MGEAKGNRVQRINFAIVLILLRYHFISSTLHDLIRIFTLRFYVDTLKAHTTAFLVLPVTALGKHKSYSRTKFGFLYVANIAHSIDHYNHS